MKLSLHWFPACRSLGRAGSPGGWSAVPELDAQQKAHVGRSVERGAERREAANSGADARPLPRAPVPFPPNPSANRLGRTARGALNGKQDPRRLGLGRGAVCDLERGATVPEGRRVREPEGSLASRRRLAFQDASSPQPGPCGGVNSTVALRAEEGCARGGCRARSPAAEAPLPRRPGPAQLTSREARSSASVRAAAPG